MILEVLTRYVFQTFKGYIHLAKCMQVMDIQEEFVKEEIIPVIEEVN